MTNFSVPDSEEEWDHLIARAAARRSGITSTAATDVAFASMLGFSTDLAELVLEHDFLQDQLRGYWAEHGVPDVITALASTPSDLGRLHQRLIEVAGSGAAQDGEPESDSGGMVVQGPWVLSPWTPEVMAADDDEVVEPFHAVEGGGDLEFFQHPLPDGRTLIEVFLSTAVASDFDLVMLRVGDESRMVVLRTDGDRLSASLEVASEGAWAEGAVTIDRPVSAQSVPNELMPEITRSVRAASESVADKNDWRAVARSFPEDHVVTRAILEGLQ